MKNLGFFNGLTRKIPIESVRIGSAVREWEEEFGEKPKEFILKFLAPLELDHGPENKGNVFLFLAKSEDNQRNVIHLGASGFDAILPEFRLSMALLVDNPLLLDSLRDWELFYASPSFSDGDISPLLLFATRAFIFGRF